MSVTIRPYRRGGWEVDIRVVTPDGARQLRERRLAPMSARSAAVRWAEGLERVLFERLMNPLQETAPPKEVPTLQEFAPRFLDGHARANRQKPSGIAAKETFVRVHLTPLLGHKTLDAIESEDVQRPAADPADGAVPRPSGVEADELIEGWCTHIVRHTFCSHLAMRGAPPRAIQELAGHRELGVTQRYMHLSPAALDSAIRLLDKPRVLET